jgi:hypothetical protein
MVHKGQTHIKGLFSLFIIFLTNYKLGITESRGRVATVGHRGGHDRHSSGMVLDDLTSIQPMAVVTIPTSPTT